MADSRIVECLSQAFNLSTVEASQIWVQPHRLIGPSAEFLCKSYLSLLHLVKAVLEVWSTQSIGNRFYEPGKLAAHDAKFLLLGAVRCFGIATLQVDLLVKGRDELLDKFGSHEPVAQSVKDQIL